MPRHSPGINTELKASLCIFVYPSIHFICKYTSDNNSCQSMDWPAAILASCPKPISIKIGLETMFLFLFTYWLVSFSTTTFVHPISSISLQRNKNQDPQRMLFQLKIKSGGSGVCVERKKCIQGGFFKKHITIITCSDICSWTRRIRGDHGPQTDMTHIWEDNLNWMPTRLFSRPTLLASWNLFHKPREKKYQQTRNYMNRNIH